MERLERITGENWREFISAPMAVLLLGRKGCPACAEWTEELTHYLEEGEFPEVRFGKMELDGKGLMDFKRENLWLASVGGLPHNVIFQQGKRAKEFSGGGVDRMKNRLNRILGS